MRAIPTDNLPAHSLPADNATGSTLATVTLIFCLISWVGTVHAAQPGRYSFDTNDDYLAPAEQFAPWAATLARHDQQREALLACADANDTCRGRLVSFNRVLSKSSALSLEEQIHLVNAYINRTRYDRDHPKRRYDGSGQRIGAEHNHWATLYEFLTENGDCEDYASAKYFMLRELGFPADNMRIVVTYERRLSGYHAVLALRFDDKQVWLLESDNVILKKYHTGYRYVYAMNENAVWDHRADY